MRRAGKHGELGAWQTGEITDDAAAEQAKHLDDVLRAHDVGVPNDEQGGRLERGNGLARRVLNRAVEIRYFHDQLMPILRVRRDTGVCLLEWGAIQIFGFHGLAPRQKLRIEAVAPVTGAPCPDEL